MTKSKGGSGHITYFIRTPNIPEFGWKLSVPGRDHWGPNVTIGFIYMKVVYQF
jgi:hypothetical protein